MEGNKKSEGIMVGSGNKLGFFRVQNDNWCPHALVLGEKLGILWDQDNNRCPRVINQFWNMGGEKNHGSCRNTSNLEYTR